jgi:hypothetical protein
MPYNNKVVLFIFKYLYFMIELYLVLSMRFGGKHNYTCEILNTKSSLILPLRSVHLLYNSLVFLTMGMSEVLQGSDYKWEQNNML